MLPRMLLLAILIGLSAGCRPEPERSTTVPPTRFEGIDEAEAGSALQKAPRRIETH